MQRRPQMPTASLSKTILQHWPAPQPFTVCARAATSKTPRVTLFGAQSAPPTPSAGYSRNFTTPGVHVPCRRTQDIPRQTHSRSASPRPSQLGNTGIMFCIKFDAKAKARPNGRCHQRLTTPLHTCDAQRSTLEVLCIHLHTIFPTTSLPHAHSTPCLGATVLISPFAKP